MSAELPSISIAQFAGIRAALAEGFELEEVLAQEGVPSWCWPDLETKMTLAVVDDEETMNRFVAHMAEAEDHLWRPVAPLDEDLDAWSGFLVALSSHPRLGEELGLRPTDLGRLQRRWAKRFEEEPKLADEAAKLRAQAPAPPEMIAAGEVELTPFSWSPAPEEAAAQHQLEPVAFLAETAPAKAGSAGEPLPFAGDRPAPPGTLAIEPVPELGQTAPLSSKPRKAATPFEPPPEVEPAAESLVAPPAGKSSMPFESLESPGLEPLAELGQTADVRPGVETPLPFRDEGSAPPAPVADQLEPSPDMGMTAPASRRGGGAATPFEPLEPAARLAATRSAVPAPTGPALPFQGKREAPGPIADELEPVAEMGQTAPLEPDEALDGTVMMDPRPDPLAGTVMMDPPTASPASWTPED